MQVAMVKRFDQNGDGKLNAQEMAAARQARGLKANSPAIPGSSEGKGANPANAPGREAILKRFDKDGDGTLNADERAAARKTLDNRKSR